PFYPICRTCRRRLALEGDALPVAWVGPEERYGEKLATPDVSMADLIGEIDPVKVAEGRYLADEETIHYGLVPRTNRGLFAINELPDLTEKVQVGLFNLMEEKDVQIKGYKVRLPLDVVIVASANPEDYTSRGRIITPLKDRFDVQIRTHYPRTLELEYVGEDKKDGDLIDRLINRAVLKVWDKYLKVEALKKVTEHFEAGWGVEVSDQMAPEEYLEGIRHIPGLREGVALLGAFESP